MKRKTTRFALTLLLSVLTATAAWADNPSWLKSGDSWDEATKTLTVNRTGGTGPCLKTYIEAPALCR